MNIGKLRHYVSLQNYTTTKNVVGEDIKVWTTYANVWAQISPSSVSNKESAEKEEVEITHKIIVRYNGTITQQDRVVYNSDTYEVVEVINYDLRKNYQIIKAKQIYPSSDSSYVVGAKGHTSEIVNYYEEEEGFSFLDIDAWILYTRNSTAYTGTETTADLFTSKTISTEETTEFSHNNLTDILGNGNYHLSEEEVDGLHSHSNKTQIDTIDATDITNLTTLTDGSNADSLHSHTISVSDISDISTSYLAIDGSNANTNIDIGSYDLSVDALNMSGVTTSTNDILIDADNKSLKVGAGSDLSIYHNGTDNYIKSVNGDLYNEFSYPNKYILRTWDSVSRILEVDLNNNKVSFGDIDGINNATYMQVDDYDFSVFSDGTKVMKLNGGYAFSCGIGDIDGAYNGTKIEIDDFNETTSVTGNLTITKSATPYDYTGISIDSTLSGGAASNKTIIGIDSTVSIFSLPSLQQTKIAGMISNLTFGGMSSDVIDGYCFEGTMSGTNPSITNFYGIYLPATPSTITNAYGVYVDDIDGSDSNYAIYTNAGKIRFGDIPEAENPSSLEYLVIEDGIVKKVTT